MTTIKQRLKGVRGRHKSYANEKRIDRSAKFLLEADPQRVPSNLSKEQRYSLGLSGHLRS